MRIILTYCFVCSCLLFAFGQTVSDSLIAPDINIISSKILKNTVGSSQMNWNKSELSANQYENVADLIQSETGVYIKSYGQGSLATSSLRGGSSGHSVVMWNDIPLNSPMLGLIDLSLLPTSFTDEMTLSLGGNSSIWGSGAIGGVISLNNIADFKNRMSVRSNNSIGSYGQRTSFNELRFGNNKIQSVSKYSISQAENDYDYFLADNLPRRVQENAALSQHNFQQEIYWRPLKDVFLSGNYWYQYSDRQIPATNAQNISEAYQIDESNRALVSFKRVFSKSVLEAKLAYTNEHLSYQDPRSGIDSKSFFQTGNLIFKYKHTFSEKHSVSIGLQEAYQTATIAAYKEDPQELTSSLFGLYKFQNKRLAWETSVRQSAIDTKIIPAVLTTGIQYDLYKNLQLQAKVSRNYNTPSFNDRYWFPGGNLDLLPEIGWSEEIGLTFLIPRINSTYEITAHNRVLDNWILWSPNPDSGFYTASNLASVWSRGMEQKISFDRQIKSTGIRANLYYNYLLSTNETDIPELNIEAGRPLLYVPKHKAGASVLMSYKALRLKFDQHWSSSVRGINDPVDPFTVGNLSASYQLEIKKVDSRIHFDIFNIWNTDYQIIERRPMPGRNFRLGIDITIVNKTN